MVDQRGLKGIQWGYHHYSDLPSRRHWNSGLYGQLSQNANKFQVGVVYIYLLVYSVYIYIYYYLFTIASDVILGFQICRNLDHPSFRWVLPKESSGISSFSIRVGYV
jgi:hypothetical protein